MDRPIRGRRAVASRANPRLRKELMSPEEEIEVRVAIAGGFQFCDQVSIERDRDLLRFPLVIPQACQSRIRAERAPRRLRSPPRAQ